MTACTVPRDMVAATLQRAMVRKRPVRLTLTGPAQIGGRIELVGDVVQMTLSGPGADELAPDEPVTFKLRDHTGVTPPIALSRVRALELAR